MEQPKTLCYKQGYKGLFVNFHPKIMVTQPYGPYGVYRNEILEQIWPLKQWNLIFFWPVQVSSGSLESSSTA